ncbi:hypothetical protein VT84_35015 [Gemmata sp. SH-PL17]|nr:hypothetical protein VT84_35015 [Gemmata sp. SH-PL17]
MLRKEVGDEKCIGQRTNGVSVRLAKTAPKSEPETGARTLPEPAPEIALRISQTP